MADSVVAEVNDDHPLALELSSLRAAVSRYQHEAHVASLKLRRHSLEASQAVEHARSLERENTRLKEEVAFLRANPDTTPTDASFRIPELTLALRRLSDKLTAVEEALSVRTKESVDACSELVGAQHEVSAARAVAAEACAREEEGLARERELERKLRAAEEERRLSDLVVQEYADLVRKLEGRPKVHLAPPSSSSVDLQRSTNGSETTLVDTLSEGKLGLHKLLEEFNGRNERLQADISKLHNDNGLLYKELEVARQGVEHDRTRLAETLHELDKYRADDNTATKMVSRYMKFSQSSTDTLQKAIDTLKVRHATTLATLNAEIAQLQRSLSRERDETERIRGALDNLTEDIAREAYGRRREVSLRLAFLGREENLAESLRRWVRKAREALERTGGSEDGSMSLNPMALRNSYSTVVAEAEALLDTLNGQPSANTEDLPPGAIARLVLAQESTASLTRELQEETIRRLNTERKLARLESAEVPHQPDESHPVIYPVPHRISEVHQERRLLDASVSATSPPIDVKAAAHHKQVVSTESSSLGSRIVEVVTISPIVALPSVRVEPSPTTSPSEATPTDISHSTPDNSLVSREPDTSNAEELLSEETLMSPSVRATHVSDTTSRLKAFPVVEQEAGDNSVPVPFPYTDKPQDVTPILATPSPIPFPSAVQETASIAGSSVLSRSHLPPLLPLETANGMSLSSFSPGLPSHNLPTTEGEDMSLLAALAKVKRRYDDVQTGFRDCHVALKELRKTLTHLPSSSTNASSEMLSVLNKAVERLVDFNEDARVELEIRIADEERVASGYEALLSIPGAMSQSDETDRVDEGEMMKEVRGFVDGSDRVVARATQQFTQKLDDLEHDIASIKRTLYELTSPDDAQPPSAAALSAKSTASPSWSAWTPSFLSPAPRSTSPAPPTFGSVMTSPRLRHSSSFSHPREPSNDEPSPDPLASLGLRIVVPVRSPTYGLGASPTGHGVPGSRAAPGPRQRTTSGMFMLGLGTRSTSFGPSMGKPALQKMPSRSTLASTSTTRLASPLVSSSNSASPQKGVAEKVEQQHGEVDSDVE
ncbi:hypothetical protein C8Q80DRAFT_1102800 [Daedaleopsis nitida]|nr:hypothetical protein C8Q80DRAFT_1102800 [Daedaleopsis nitida]